MTLSPAELCVNAVTAQRGTVRERRYHHGKHSTHDAGSAELGEGAAKA
jgi:hypothetical protein